MSWIAQGSGDWSTGSNWSTGAVPQPGDNVVIDVPGLDVTVTYTGNATLQLGNLTNNEQLVLDGSGGASWNSGIWDGSGAVENLTTLAISGSADKTLKDGEAINNEGTTTLSGTGNIVGIVGASITNDGVFNVESDADITFPSGVGDGIFENDGTFIKSSPGVTEIGGAQGFRFENSVNNIVAYGLSTPGVCLVQQGTLELGDNQNTAVTVGGTFQVSAGATLEYNQGVANIIVLRPPSGPQVIPSITGQGTLEVSGATVQFYGTLAIHEIDVSAGSLQLQQNMANFAGTTQSNTSPVTAYGTADILKLSGGSFGGNGGGIFTAPSPINHEERPALVVGTTFEWTGGNLSGAGRLVIDSSVTTSTISTTAAKSIIGGFGLDLLGETIWTDSGTITMNGASAIYIHESGTLWDQGNGTIVQGTVDTNGGNIWNTGNILKEDGTGTTTFGAGIEFVNDINDLNFVTTAIPVIQYNDPGNVSDTFARLDIRTGTVSLQGTSINRNTISIHPGATLSYDAGTHMNVTYATSNDVSNASILGVDGGGTVNFGNVVFDSDNESLVDVPTVNFGTGTYSFDNTAGGAQRILTGTFTGGTTGTITGSGTLEIVNTFLWTTGAFRGVGGTTSSLLIDSGAVLTLESGGYTTANSYNVDNRGTIEWATSPGSLSINGNFDQTSTGTFISKIVDGSIHAEDSLDNLVVSGTVTLGGALDLNLGSPFTPVEGQVFTLITGANPVVGQFVGLAEGATVTLGSTTFELSYVGGIAGDKVTLTTVIAPVVTIATPAPDVRSATNITDLVFTVSLSFASTTAVTVTYATSNGTAIAGTDYTTTTGTLTIPAGQTTGTITVPILPTTLVDPTLTFTMTLSNPVLSTLGTPFSAVGSIVDPLGPPLLSLSETAYTVNENAGFVTITVSTTDSTIPTTVAYTTVDGTAIAGTDYTATSGILTLASGVSQATFNVPIIDENIDIGSKVFTVVLSSPTGSGVTLATSTATVTILDNDAALPSISIANTTITEPVSGQVNAVFNLTLSAAESSAATVQYATADGSAVAGIKYVTATGTVTFQPGQTTAQLTVPVLSDFTQTTTETFSVDLSDPVNAMLANTTATGTVLSQTVTTVPISAGHAFKYLDAFNRHATISLTGPGSGTITYLGLTIVDAKKIVLNGTTGQSQLSVKTDQGQTAVIDVIVNGSLKAINAPVLNLLGNLNVTGTVQTLHLASLEGGNSVTIGAGSTPLTATLANVVNSTFTSATPIAALHLTSWQDTAGGAGLTASSVNTITVADGFDANISLTGNLTSMMVHGALTGSDIEVGGSIGALTAGTIANSEIFAGVLDTVTTLPTDTSDFTDTTSAIKRLTVTSKTAGAFASTLIVAPTIGTLELGNISVFNNGTTFGVAGNTVGLVQGVGTRPIKLTGANLGSPFSDSNLVVRLT